MSGHKSRTVLVIDDEYELVQMLSVILRAAGYDVLEVHGPEHAVALCLEADRSIDLVVCDFTMPGQNGMQLSKSLRRVRPSLEFVFMSASSAAFDELVSGGLVCLRKPFSAEELLDTVCERFQAVQQRLAGGPAV